MSTVETAPKVITFERTIVGFDKDLKNVEKTVSGSYTEVASQEDALAVLNRTNSFIEAANVIVKKEAISKAKNEAGLEGGFDRETVMNFIKPWREMPQFSAMVKAEDKRKATADEWNAQTEAILEQVRQIPVLMAQLKAASDKVVSAE